VVCEPDEPRALHPGATGEPGCAGCLRPAWYRTDCESAASWARVRALGAYGVGVSQPLGVTRLGLLGVPTSVASFAPGQEKAPRALRDAGIFDALLSAGVEVEDYGDLPARRWAPDHLNTRAQNVAAVVDDVIGVRDRIGHIIGAGRRHLVLGGSCAVEIGVVAGYLAAGFERPGVVYADLNTRRCVARWSRMGPRSISCRLGDRSRSRSGVAAPDGAAFVYALPCLRTEAGPGVSS